MANHSEHQKNIVGKLRAAAANSLALDQAIKEAQDAGYYVTVEEILAFLNGFKLPEKSERKRLVSKPKSFTELVTAEDSKFLGSFKISVEDPEVK